MNKKILIIGLGLIGGSYAKGLMKKNYEVYGVARRREVIEYAKQNNFIIDGTIDLNKEYISDFDRIIFGLYPKALIEFVDKYKNDFKPETIITDVTGVKGAIVDIVQNELDGKAEFIPAHPMAGKEKLGIENADYKIFKNANYIITPTDKNTEKGIEFAKQIATDLEFRKISILSVDEHDEMIAYLSQLTHCIAVALMTGKNSTHLVDYTGDSFRDLTRIANIDENMWSELFLLNKDKLIKEMEIFENEFDKLKNAIKNEDVDTMKQMMRLSSERRKHFDIKS